MDKKTYNQRSTTVNNAINGLLDAGLISTTTYAEFLMRLLDARTEYDLDRIIEDVKGLCKKGGDHGHKN